MAISIYDCMKEGNVKDDKGYYYPDVLTSNINNIKLKNLPTNYILTENDLNRFDLFMYRQYSDSNYDDLVLYLNGVYKNDLQVDDTILLPSIIDIINFYITNRKIQK